MRHSGLLNTNKPAGITSRQVVDHVQRLVRPSKAGHAGTLDPLATGVLVVCVGAATRLIEYVQRMPKQYQGTFLLGRHSPTEDIEGEVTPLADAPTPSADDIQQAAAALTGQIEQRPPAFSALKVAGKRSYDLARAGKQVDLKPRSVTIHSIDVLRYEYPELSLDVRCGSGTYIRSLGRDLAESLGTAAVMSALVRTAIGSLVLDEACQLTDLDQDSIATRLLPPLCAVDALPTIQLSEEQLRRISHGMPIRAELAEESEMAAIDPQGRLAAILQQRQDGQLWPVRNLSPN